MEERIERGVGLGQAEISEAVVASELYVGDVQERDRVLHGHSSAARTRYIMFPLNLPVNTPVARRPRPAAN